ncbi:MAG TPA: flavin reductase family protein [Longimicrobiaceae bacterium]|nr:flavin reductase family protein [Longimicrobiaceae bacterium]
MIEASEFRRVMGHFATGVTVVTATRGDGSACGLTVNAFASVSLEPPLILVCIERGADSHGCIRAAGAFAVNVLDEKRGERLSRRFAAWDVEEKLRGVAYRAERTGAPVLEDALAWLDCRIHDVIDAGDHSIFLGEVVAADAREGAPLVYYRGGYGRFVP